MKLNISSSQDNIPARVDTELPLQLAESKIPGAGRGLFVHQDVKAGELLFQVPNVMLAIISKENLTTTCDNCFAHKSKYGQTVEAKDLSFFACGKCQVAHYCSNSCQSIAWDAYHQYECPVLSSALGGEVEGNENERERVKSEDFRTIIRMLCLHAAGKYSDAEWTELTGLRGQPASPDGSDTLSRVYGRIKDLVLKSKISKLDTQEVDSLFRAYINNRCFVQLWTPCTEPVSNLTRYRTVEVPIGECLEPFYAMINHACDPNATWVSEGRSIQVRAEKDIAAGDELTICYGWTEMLEARQKKLAQWIGRCVCSLCSNPPAEPTGNLRNCLIRLINTTGPAATPSQARSISLQSAIRDMEKAKLPPGAWPLRHLYSQLFRCRCGQYDGPEMLKVWLKLYYVVEPAMVPQQCIANRIRSLSILTVILDLNDESYKKLKPYPEDIVKLAPWLYYQLRVKLLDEIRRCRSKAAYCVQVEERNFAREFEELEREAEGREVQENDEAIDGRIYVPFLKSPEAKKGFVLEMNQLLAWAGIGEQTESQILSLQGR